MVHEPCSFLKRGNKLHESFPLLLIRHARSRFARDLGNIADLGLEGGLKMLLIRVNSIDRFLFSVDVWPT